ncbi:MAG: hypothetical protein ACI4N3_02120 [Alphaproteobacteria bacterium]
MKKFYILLLLMIYSVPVMAVPGRLQGFSYTGRIKPETEAFNEKPAIYDEEPLPPHYLNEDGSDARTGAISGGDKYKLTPVYSMQELYNLQNGYETGVIEDDVSDDEENVDE